MKVGFITQLLWVRYGSFWVKMFENIGVEVVFPNPKMTYKAQNINLEEVSGFVFRLAVLQAIMLDVDFVVAPNINFDSKASKGSAQDLWIADFPNALASQVRSLSPILPVPATLNLPLADLEKLAMQTLYPLTHQATEVKRAWERYSSGIKDQVPAYAKAPQGENHIGVIGQPWLLSEDLVKALGVNKFFAQHKLDPGFLQKEGMRVRKDLLSSDTEVIGAAHYLDRKGSIKEIIMLADNSSGADVWLTKRVGRIINKPFSVKYIQDLLPISELVGKLTVNPK